MGQCNESAADSKVLRIIQITENCIREAKTYEDSVSLMPCHVLLTSSDKNEVNSSLSPVSPTSELRHAWSTDLTSFWSWTYLSIESLVIGDEGESLMALMDSSLQAEI